MLDFVSFTSCELKEVYFLQLCLINIKLKPVCRFPQRLRGKVIRSQHSGVMSIKLVNWIRVVINFWRKHIKHFLYVMTCLSTGRDLPADFVPLDGPQVDSVEDPRPQVSHTVRSAFRPDWDFLARALWGAVGYDVAINLCLDWIPRKAEAGLCYILG